MKEILEKITASEFRDFKRMVMERTGWTSDQFGFRKSGRTKLTPLERNELMLIALEIQKKRGSSMEPVFCNDDCLLHFYRRCPFDKLEECPMYNHIKTF